MNPVESAKSILESLGLNELLQNPIQNFSKILKVLEENTGEGKPIDINIPIIWHRVAYPFVEGKQYLLAEKIYQHLYELGVNHQLTKSKLVHKGMAIHNIGWINSLQNNLDLTLKFTAMGLIEDALHMGGDSYKSGMAFPVLKDLFDIPESLLSDLVNFARKFKAENRPMEELLPENILLEFNHMKRGNVFYYRKDNFVRINQSYLSYLLTKLKSTTDKTARGNLLEKIAFYLFSSMPNIIVARNWRTHDEEIDLILRNDNATHPILSLFEKYILVESKCWEKKVNVGHVNHFLSKLKFHDCKLGILISTEGISGSEDEKKYAWLTRIKEFHRHGTILLQLTLKDLESISKGEKDLLQILLEEYESIRFEDFGKK